MEFIVALNKILDLRIVQYALLAFSATLIILMLVLNLKYGALKLNHALLESSYNKNATALVTQNESIKQLGIERDLQKKVAEQAAGRAKEIAIKTKGSLRSAQSVDLKGGNCSEKVHRVFLAISSSRD